MPVLGPKMMGRGAGFQIVNSCRFNDDDSANLSRTPAASNRDTWTFAAWVKRCNMGSFQQLFSGGSDTSNLTRIRFRTDDTLEYEHADGSLTDQLLSTAVFRDPPVGGFVFEAGSAPGESVVRFSGAVS